MYKFLWCSSGGTWVYIVVEGEIAQLSESEIQRRYKEDRESLEDYKVVGQCSAYSWSGKLHCVKGSLYRDGCVEIEWTLEQPDIKRIIEKNINEEYKKIARYLK